MKGTNIFTVICFMFSDSRNPENGLDNISEPSSRPRTQTFSHRDGSVDKQNEKLHRYLNKFVDRVYYAASMLHVIIARDLGSTVCSRDKILLYIKLIQCTYIRGINTTFLKLAA